MKRMLRKRIWIAVSLGLLLSGCNRPATKIIRTSADVVTPGGSGTAVSIGSSGEVPILISIDPGYHINANPATFDYLIATELTADQSEGITFGKPVYPAAGKKQFQFADQPLAVYEGQVQIKLPLQAAATATKGNRTLSLHLRVQACDEEKCFPPATVPVTLAVDLK